MKWMFQKTKFKKRLLVAEMTLLIASVFIFRGLWLLLDLSEWMFTRQALWLSLVIGIILSVLALRYIIKHSKE